MAAPYEQEALMPDIDDDGACTDVSFLGIYARCTHFN